MGLGARKFTSFMCTNQTADKSVYLLRPIGVFRGCCRVIYGSEICMDVQIDQCQRYAHICKDVFSFDWTCLLCCFVPSLVHYTLVCFQVGVRPLGSVASTSMQRQYIDVDALLPSRSVHTVVCFDSFYTCYCIYNSLSINL